MADFLNAMQQLKYGEDDHSYVVICISWTHLLRTVAFWGLAIGIDHQHFQVLQCLLCLMWQL